MADRARKAPISRDPAIVRNRILDAAEQEFMAASGYAAASTNRMLTAFGGSKPTMFRHFPTKRALFVAVVARIAARWPDAITWRAIPAAEPRDWLQTFAVMALRWTLASENLFVGRMAIAEGEAFPEIAETYRTLAVDPIKAVLTDQLAAWSRQGLLTCADPTRDAMRFLDLTISGVVSRALYRVAPEIDDAALGDHVAHCVALFLDGRSPTRRQGHASGAQGEAAEASA